MALKYKMKAVVITCSLLIACITGYSREYNVPYDLSKFGIPVTIKTTCCKKPDYLTITFRDNKEDLELMITQHEAVGQWRLKKHISMDIADDSEELKIVVKEPDGYIGVSEGVYAITYYKELNGFTIKSQVTAITTRENASAIYSALKGKPSTRYNQSSDLSKFGIPLVIKTSPDWKLDVIEMGVVIDIDRNTVHIRQRKTDKSWESAKLVKEDMENSLGNGAKLITQSPDGFISYKELDNDEYYDINYYKQINGNTIRFNAYASTLATKERAKDIYNAMKGK